MQLKGLFQTAFRGCGTSLASVLDSARYHELLARPVIDGQDASMAALIDLLGETIIDVIIRRQYLPERARNLAGRWDSLSADDQIQVCRVLRHCFRFHEGSRHRDREPDELRPFLPEHFKSWDRSKHKPSCAGVGALLAAFAKLTGAPHYLVAVQRTIDEPILHSVARLMTNASAVIARTLPRVIGQDRRAIYITAAPEWIRANLEAIGDYDFHQALLIQVVDGRWILVDPYMGNVSELSPDDWPVKQAITQISGRPERSAWLYKPAEAWYRESRFASELTEIDRILTLVNQGEIVAPRTPLTRIVPRLRRYLKQLDQDDSSSIQSKLLYSNETALHAAAVPYNNDNETHHLATSEVLAIMRQSEKAGGKDRALRRERILFMLLAGWEHNVDFQCAKQDRQAIPHPSIAISDVARTLGVRTLVNIRSLLRRRRIIIGGALLPYSDCDTVWYNALVDQGHGSRFTSNEQALLTQITERLRQIPPAMLHPIIAKELQ